LAKLLNAKYRISLLVAEVFSSVDFSFKCLICGFSQEFSFYNSVWIRIRIRIRNLFLDSDPAKTFRFFRIRIHNSLSIWFRFDVAFFIISTSLEQLCQFAVQFKFKFLQV
jgi:hypothetical protein